MNNTKKTNIKLANKIFEQRYFGNEINELAPSSVGVQDFLDTVKKHPEAIEYMGFESFKSLREFIMDNDVKDFTKLLIELEEYFKKKKKK